MAGTCKEPPFFIFGSCEPLGDKTMIDKIVIHRSLKPHPISQCLNKLKIQTVGV